MTEFVIKHRDHKKPDIEVTADTYTVDHSMVTFIDATRRPIMSYALIYIGVIIDKNKLNQVRGTNTIGTELRDDDHPFRTFS